MPKDPRIDAYIDKSAEFARPILMHIRDLVHRGCPGVQETLKWGMPAFVHKRILCITAAFKSHAVLNFWRSDLIVQPAGKKQAMGQFGRLTSLKDLPPDADLLHYIRKAAELNEAGVTRAARARSAKSEITIPPYLAGALKRNKQAKQNFDKFSYSHKKEYVEWLTSAKREETRQKRLETALTMIAQGRPQNGKYSAAGPRNR